MNNLRNAKIVGKIADNNAEPDFIKALFETGVDVSWLNTAHQDEPSTLEVIEKIRAISTDVPILIDTKGPEIRTKNIENPIELNAGEEFVITGDLSVTGEKVIYTAYENLAGEVPVGSMILIDDGEFACEVKSIDGTKLICVAGNSGKIKNKKSINIPGVHIELPALSEKDKGFVHFCAKNDVDYITHSFVRSKKDIDEIKEILNQYDNHDVKIIAKIENREGFENLDEILENCEGLMVARGDLGVEVPFEEVPYMQKRMIEKAIQMGKIAIVATQALHTMIENPRPTRAEVSDIANSILDGTDSVSMSGETAYGKYPLESVNAMARIMKMTEAHRGELNFTESRPFSSHPLHVVTESVVFTADASKAKAIIVPCVNAKIAQALSVFRPDTPIFAFSSDKRVVRALRMSYGVHSKFVEGSNEIELLKNGLKQIELAETDRIVVVTPENDDAESFDIDVITVAQAFKK